jgi:Protein of unknown function (DUF3644)
MAISLELANKSVSAAVAAIEIYNKPNFSYREEAFSLLMVNAWELLLKAKWLLDHAEAIESLYEYDSTPAGTKAPRTNRSGNPITFGAVYIAAKLLEDKHSGLERPCSDNVLAIIEIRDNAAHFLNKDLYLGRRVLEIGTASLRNYLLLITEWFQIDLSSYNFFLMPISFYHGFEAAEPSSLTQYSDQVQRLLTFLDNLEEQSANEDDPCKQHLALRLETKLVRGKDAASMAFRWTDDKKAPALTIHEEDVLKNYPWTYRELSEAMKRRYSDFVVNKKFHVARKPLERIRKYAIVRLLNPGNPRSPKQMFYNANILQEFDRHYTQRKKA